MNQDAFRQLLQTTKPAESRSPNGSRAASQPKKKYGITPASQPAFQPRKVKGPGPGSSYRDRASERRAGIIEYEKIELHDLQKETANLGDRDEQYLEEKGHTGLDVALLEQNKAQIAASNAAEEDETLETVFRQKSDQPAASNKRTREDIIRELKERKAQEATVTAPGPSATEGSLERAKALGKFKPIGAPDPSNEKKREAREGKEHMRKRKRRKIENDRNKPEMNVTLSESLEVKKQASPVERNLESSAVKGSTELDTIAEAVTEEPDSGLDIFADVEEYKGIDLGDDEDEDEKDLETENTMPRDSPAPPIDKKWFDDDVAITPMAGRPFPHSLSPIRAKPDEVQEETESIQVTKLTPLASSAVPSIRDLLVLDAAAEAEAKRKARKEKKKAKSAEGGSKKELSEAAKLDRDYKKLNSYMSKKG